MGSGITAQILWGSLVLGLCSIIHLSVMIYWVRSLRSFDTILQRTTRGVRLFALIGSTFAVVVFAHTIQVWLWAFSFLVLDALPSLSEAIYFSLVTYTTVGYGDVTMSADFRIFGAMASVTGLLNFGLSTAFLVGLLGKLFPDHLD